MNHDPKDLAPGAPGMEPHRAKTILSGLGTSIQPSSRIYFHATEGMISRICYPDGFQLAATDLHWIVTNGTDFFSEEGRHTHPETIGPEEGIPAYRMVQTCTRGRYTLHKEVITDPFRDTFLQKNQFTWTQAAERPQDPASGAPGIAGLSGTSGTPGPSGAPGIAGPGEGMRYYLLLTPCIGGDSNGHTAWIGDYKGIPMLFAQKGEHVLALACSQPMLQLTVGFHGVSDGWMDLAAHYKLTRISSKADTGHVVLTAEIGSHPANIWVAISMGASALEAGAKAWGSLMDGFETIKERYTGAWRQWQLSLSSAATGNTLGKFIKRSTSVLKYGESKTNPGAQQEGAFLQPKITIEAARSYLTLASKEDTLRLLGYLMSTQEPEGYWASSSGSYGIPSTSLSSLDLVSEVILLMDQCRRKFFISPEAMNRYWPMIWKAAAYLVTAGPLSPMDRWNLPLPGLDAQVSAHWNLPPGHGSGSISIYSLGAEIAALLAVADMAEERQQPGIATYCRKTADYLFEHIDDWNYVKGTDQARETGVDGYYVHEAPMVSAPGLPAASTAGSISADPLFLVRFGLRTPDDPRIQNTLTVIDKYLKLDTPLGPCYKRFPWERDIRPQLVAERAMFDCLGSGQERARQGLAIVESLAENGYFPEEIQGHIPHAHTHTSYIQLCHMIREGAIFPRFTTERYLDKNPQAPFLIWRMTAPCARLPRHKKLRIELPESALIHWSDDEWATKQHTLTRDTLLGVHVAELSPKLSTARELTFTFFWLGADQWENKNFTVRLI
jgi:glucoamylase